MKKNAVLWEKLKDNKVHCYLCAHNCVIDSDDFGFCGMRQNKGGDLFTYAYGEVIANHVDPIEKKPLYHFLPGTTAYSVATIGCNFHCSFCQNWSISQLSVRKEGMEGYELKPEDAVRDALDKGCKSIAYTYTEPTIFFEYAYDTAKFAKQAGLRNTFVTNGYMTKAAIDTIKPYLDAANIDLKFFNDKSYEKICGGHLAPVTESIKNMKAAGIWVEVTTLIVPGENDSEEELRAMAEFIASVGKEIPWHVSRFHPDYKYVEAHTTPLETIERAKEIGKEAGLKYVYLGNVPLSKRTTCSGCGKELIARDGYSIGFTKDFEEDGKCKGCGTVVEGIWK